MISRRSLLWVPALAACGRRRRGAGFRGYAFVANEEGQSIAAVDLEAMAVARHIPLAGEPSQVLTGEKLPSVYALTRSNGTIHEIEVDRLNFTRKLSAASSAIAMQLAADGSALYLLARDPRALVRVSLESFEVDWRLPLPDEPVDFALASDSRTAAISFQNGVRLVDLLHKKVGNPLAAGSFGGLHFLNNATTLIAANLGEKKLSIFDVESSGLLTHLPLSVRPDHLCANRDDGQLFVTGEGMDAVVVVYPYHTPQVAETVFAGHQPGPMAVSQQFLFVANPQSNDVSILDINSRRVIAVVSVGTNPGFITVTPPNDEYALVLNRTSGDISVLRIGAITRNRDRRASQLTVIPVGSRPVSAAVRAV